jgi:antitoxin HicB
MTQNPVPAEYTVILQRETDPEFSGYYNATVPALPGCASYGEDRAEALHNIQEAIRLYLDELRARGEPLPDDRFEQVRVAV